ERRLLVHPNRLVRLIFPCRRRRRRRLAHHPRVRPVARRVVRTQPIVVLRARRQARVRVRGRIRPRRHNLLPRRLAIRATLQLVRRLVRHVLPVQPDLRRRHRRRRQPRRRRRLLRRRRRHHRAAEQLRLRDHLLRGRRAPPTQRHLRPAAPLHVV